MDIVDRGIPSDFGGLDLSLDLKLGLDDGQSNNGSQVTDNSFLGTGASTSQLLHFGDSAHSPVVPASSLSDNEEEQEKEADEEKGYIKTEVMDTPAVLDRNPNADDAVSIVEEEERRVAQSIQQRQVEMQDELQRFNQRQQLHQQEQFQKQQALAQLQLRKQKLQQQL